MMGENNMQEANLYLIYIIGSVAIIYFASIRLHLELRAFEMISKVLASEEDLICIAKIQSELLPSSSIPILRIVPHGGGNEKYFVVTSKRVLTLGATGTGRLYFLYAQ